MCDTESRSTQTKLIVDFVNHYKDSVREGYICPFQSVKTHPSFSPVPTYPIPLSEKHDNVTFPKRPRHPYNWHCLTRVSAVSVSNRRITEQLKLNAVNNLNVHKSQLTNLEILSLDMNKLSGVINKLIKGLGYLHHDCSPSIIHRDVKSNNILLDGDYEAHVADFGLAKFWLGGGASDQCMSSIAGSHGYIAPEYACTLKVDQKSDVYSGVVLLEIITGRKPVGEFGDGVDIVRWVRYCVGDVGCRLGAGSDGLKAHWIHY